MVLKRSAPIRRIGTNAAGRREFGAAAAQQSFTAMLAGEVPPDERDYLPIAIAGGELARARTIGYLRALEARTVRLVASPSRPRPIVLPACCGTRRQPNLTALIALLLQRYGVPVLVHGNPDRVPGHVTTADVLCELGIEPAVNREDAQTRLARDNFAFLPVDVLVPGLARLLRCRGDERARPTLHVLARLIDPFGGDGYRVVSAVDAGELARVRELLVFLRADGLLLPGTEGEPFANPSAPAPIERFAAGVGSVCAEAEDAGTPHASIPLPAPDATATAAWIAQVLVGTQPVPAPIVAQLACCLDGARRTRQAAGV